MRDEGRPRPGRDRSGVRARIVAEKRRNGRGAKAGQGDGCAMNKPTEDSHPAVAVTPTQGGEVRARWAGTEPAVWTERMLTALDNGVRGGRWFSLIDKV